MTTNTHPSAPFKTLQASCSLPDSPNASDLPNRWRYCPHNGKPRHKQYRGDLRIQISNHGQYMQPLRQNMFWVVVTLENDHVQKRNNNSYRQKGYCYANHYQLAFVWSIRLCIIYVYIYIYRDRDIDGYVFYTGVLVCIWRQQPKAHTDIHQTHSPNVSLLPPALNSWMFLQTYWITFYRLYLSKLDDSMTILLTHITES